MNLYTKTLLSLIALALVDIVVPVPIMAFVLIYVLHQKPPWFKNLVTKIYRT